ncbi:MAG: acyltransferase, partial [Porphyromonas endodontalis]
DYLKAIELLARQQNGEYHKSPGEDVLNMREGLMGKKGRIHITIGTPLRELISEVELPKSPKDQLLLAAELIDREIHRHYRLYPANYIADDLLRGSTHHHTAGHYSSKEQGEFEQYIETQLDKCPTPQEARPHLRQQMLLMYANPLRNHLLAIKGGE